MLIKTIKPNPDNPRVIKDEKYINLRESIKNFPQGLRYLPLVVDKNNMIIIGNQRLAVLRELGYTELDDNWVIKADDLNEAQLRELLIRSNTHAGAWDYDMLANQYDMDELELWGVEIPYLGSQNPDYLNSTDEWVGMPEFTPKEGHCAIVVNFENEKDRDEFDKKYKFIYTKKGVQAWSTWYPPKERADLNSVKVE